MNPSAGGGRATSPIDAPSALGREADGVVRWLLDGEVIALPQLAPQRTVLEVLREELGRTGTKEGCAEGDCGACTVLVGELDRESGEVRYRSINACIQLAASLDGRELLTVESLSRPGERLHPVQEAMVECHGSQCGFCTPGFVMALLALYFENEQPTRAEIDAALAGNLCRCTGYRPIAAAAKRMGELAARAQVDVPWLELVASARRKVSSPAAPALRALVRSSPLALAARQGTFWAPETLDQACAIYAQHPMAVPVSGGTDVGLWITKQRRELPELLFLGNVPELRKVVTAERELCIGAGAPLCDALPPLSAEYPGLEELCARFASPPIRNVATLGGNLANASPVGDMAPALLVLDAELTLRRAGASRRLALRDFFLAYQVTARAAGELLTHVHVPRARPEQRVFAYKVTKRFDQDIAALSGAFSADVRDGVLTRVRVAFGGMAATPKRAEATERALEGRALAPATLEAGVEVLAQDYAPIGDLRASAEYRARVAANLLRRFFMACAGDPSAHGVYRYAR